MFTYELLINFFISKIIKDDEKFERTIKVNTIFIPSLYQLYLLLNFELNFYLFPVSYRSIKQVNNKI